MKPFRVLMAAALFGAMAAEEASAQYVVAPNPLVRSGPVVMAPTVRMANPYRRRRRHRRRRVVVPVVPGAVVRPF
jgi:hypothetical protein